MLANLLFKISDIFIFLFIFSIFNDSYTADIFGEYSLKIIFAAFLFFKFTKIIKIAFNENTIREEFLFLFLFLLIISTFVTAVLQSGTHNIFISVPLILSAMIIPLFFKGYPLKKTLYSLWISMVFSIIICFFSEPITEWTFRRTGGVGDPNEFAAQLLVFLCVSIYLFSKNKNTLFILISLVLFTYAILISGSKSGLIMLLLILLLLLAKYLNRASVAKVVVVSIPFLFILPIFDYSQFEIIANVLDRFEGNRSANQRFESWDSGFRHWQDSISLGYGAGHFLPVMEDYHGVSETPELASHNMYLKVLVESGIVVFIVYMIFLSILMLSNIRTLLNSDYFYLWLAMLSLLLMGLTLGILYDKYFLLMIGVILHVQLDTDRAKT